MLWQFPVDEGTPVEVRLYLMNGFSGTSQPGQRIFDIQLDGDTVVDGLDLSAEAGHEVATMRSFATVSDGSIDLEFIHRTENPLINGIEIITLDDPTPDPGELTATPTSLTFGEVTVGEVGTQTLTLTNTGGQPVAIGQVSFGGLDADRFALVGTPPTVVAAGGSVPVEVTFTPTVAGAASATLTITHDGVNSPLVVGLSGSGVLAPEPGDLTATPTSLAFGSVEVGEAGTATVVVANTGGTAVTVAQVGIVGDDPSLFTVIDGPVAPFELAPGASTSLQVRFAPQVQGTFTATLRLGHNGANGPLDIALSGDGVQTPEPGELTATPTSLAFGSVTVGESGTQTLTLTNTGGQPVAIGQVSFGGLDADRFALVGTPPTVVAAGGSVPVEVTFTPTVAGAASATLTITHDGVNSPLVVGLSGSGVLAPEPGDLTATPTSLAFGSVEVGEAGTATVVVANTGGTAVTVAQVGIVGDDPSLFTVIDGPVAPFELAPGASTSLQVRFAPQVQGTFTATLRLGHNGANGPLDIALSGDGVQTPEPGELTATPTSLAFGSVTVGESGTQTLTLTNTGGQPVAIGQVSFGGLDADRFALVGTPPTVVAAGGSVPVEVTFTPTVAGAASATLTITHDGVNSPLVVGLSGSGTAPDPGDPGEPVAADAFARSVSSGWGNADVGGAWTVNVPSSFSVSGGAGRIAGNVAGASRVVNLNSVSVAEVDVTAVLSLDRPATGGGTYVSLVGRRQSPGNEYRAQLRFLAQGSVAVSLHRIQGWSDTMLGSVTVPGLTYAPDEQLRVRFQLEGSGLRAKLWRDGATEPDGWLIERTDTTATLQSPGAVGILHFQSSSATNLPITLSVHDYTAYPPYEGTIPGGPGDPGDPGDPPGNEPPAAGFVSVVSGLSVAVDASGSLDPDGSIERYDWDFGDGSSGLGVTAEHTYGAAGSYTVRLTVTDDRGATATASEQVVVSAPDPGDPGEPVAADAFARSVSSGWGNADVGGAWTVNVPSSFSVSGGAGRIAGNVAGASRVVNLNSVSVAEVDVTAVLSLDRPATGGGTYVSLVGRRQSPGNEYRAQLRFLAQGSVAVSLHRIQGWSDTMLGSVTVPGLTYAPDEQLRVRFQLEGSGLRAKLWRDGATEPDGWLIERTDTTATLQSPGAVGILHFQSSSATNLPITLSVHDYTAYPPYEGTIPGGPR
jgi:hypothetical protein